MPGGCRRGNGCKSKGCAEGAPTTRSVCGGAPSPRTQSTQTRAVGSDVFWMQVSSLETDMVKLTAQFVAKNGRQVR